MTAVADTAVRARTRRLAAYRDAVRYGPMAAAVEVMSKHILRRHIAKVHARLIEHLCSGPLRSAYVYRGSGKSFTFTVPYLLTLLVRNSEARILLLARTEEMAEGFSNLAKMEIETNATFIECFGDLRGPRWTSKRWTISTRTGRYIEPTVTIGSVGGSVVSRHYTDIIADDLLDDKNTLTVGQRARMAQWWDTALYPTLIENGTIKVVGTRYHPNDLYSKIDHDFGKCASMALPAISRKVWGDDEVPWLEKHPKSFFTERREKMTPDAYAGQYDQDVERMKGKIIMGDWLTPNMYREGEQGRFAYSVLIADFSSSENDLKKNSHFALMMLGVDGEGHGWLRDRFQERGMSFDQQCDKLLEWAKRGATWIGLEAVHAQRWMQQHMRDSHGIANVIPIMPNEIANTPKADKVARARIVLAPFCRQGKFHIRQDFYDVYDELTMFPNGDSDDLVDCAVMGVHLITQIGYRGGAGSRSAGVSAGMPEDERGSGGVINEEF